MIHWHPSLSTTSSTSIYQHVYYDGMTNYYSQYGGWRQLSAKAFNISTPSVWKYNCRPTKLLSTFKRILTISSAKLSFVTFYISALEILLLTYLLTTYKQGVSYIAQLGEGEVVWGGRWYHWIGHC